MQALTQTRPPGQPWTLREAADFLQVSERTITRLIEAEKVKSVRLGLARGRVLIPDAEIRRLAGG
jgi:excisionase family DNA binding protein